MATRGFFASLGVLAILALSLLAPLSPEIKRILEIADTTICFVFLADFGLLLYLHKNRKKYFFTWGWIDLISSIPLFDPLRWGRLARMVRLLRLFRGLRGSTGLLRRLLLSKQETTLAAIFLLIAAVMVPTGTVGK
ncbi:MAG TPA: ion transporter [Chthoniobacterales bacterium]